MDREISLFEERQISKTYAVLQLMASNPRMSQKDACNHIGIDPKTYRKWIATQDEALSVFEEARKDVERNELSTMLIMKNAILQQLLSDSIKKDIPIPDRLKVLEHVNTRIDELSDQYHPVDAQAEQELLNGPQTQFGQSKLANRVSIVNSSTETVITIKDKPETIDLIPEPDK